MTVIRAATEGDKIAIWTILEPVFRAGDTYAIDPSIGQEDGLAYWFGRPRQVFVVEDQGQILGTYYIVRNQGGGGSHVCNCGFATAEAARGKGIARQMLTHALGTAKDLGFHAMQFNFVVEANTRAVDTWLRAGFEAVGRLPEAFRHPTLGPVDALVMYKKL
ncbi:GNAT family N-acetyltransferase [Pseudoprimorskyibacter insulae]|uniref:N-acetyltransferase domain-containing protein n=1 Tax=Pseudoprimorskyibacter insulae TaxID=1695997 RepID=A0A2R8AYM7_9RHOB|nr:GNAT family N-acetyltransferase [Pseudoprimorskyibacter insulae]SPF81110.1 hypothetical protein PRI8871_02928 [Pseudoprimorskyibacter insulae]